MGCVNSYSRDKARRFQEIWCQSRRTIARYACTARLSFLPQEANLFPQTTVFIISVIIFGVKLGFDNLALRE
jgi:hypothetical protein